MTKGKMLFLSLLLTGFLIVLLIVHTISNKNMSFSEFGNMVFKNEVSSDTLSLHYTLASPARYNISPGTPTLPLFLPDMEKSKYARIENYIKTLETFDVSKLSLEDSYTCMLLTDKLSNELLGNRFYYLQELLSPSGGIQTQYPVLMAEYEFRTHEDIDDYLALLADTPDYFASLLRFENEKANRGYFMADYTLAKVCSQCSSLFDPDILQNNSHFLQQTFTDRLQEAVSNDLITQAEAAEYEKEHTDILLNLVSPSYIELSNSLMKLSGSGKNESGLAHFSLGKDYYQWLFSSNTGSDAEIPSAYRALSSNYYEHLKKLTEDINAFNQYKNLSSEELNYFPLSAPEEMLQDLAGRMKKDFPDITSLPTYSECSVMVKNVSPALEDYTAPAYYMTPPIDDVTDNVIYINGKNVPAGISLYTTLAHEGYPGHLFQTTYSHLYQQGEKMPPIRSILNYPGYAEGWALYTELFAFSYAGNLLFEETGKDYYALLYDIFKEERCTQLAMLSLLDLGIHYYGFSKEKAASILKSYGIQDENQIQGIYEYIVEEPANYPKYYWSYLQFEELKKKAEEKWGNDYSDYRFHTFLLHSGPSDFKNLEERLMKEDTPISLAVSQESSSIILSKYPLSHNSIFNFRAASTAGLVKY